MTQPSSLSPQKVVMVYTKLFVIALDSFERISKDLHHHPTTISMNILLESKMYEVAAACTDGTAGKGKFDIITQTEILVGTKIKNFKSFIGQMKSKVEKAEKHLESKKEESEEAEGEEEGDEEAEEGDEAEEAE